MRVRFMHGDGRYQNKSLLVAVLALALLACVHPRTEAQYVAPPTAEKLRLHSNVLGEDRTLLVRLPTSYAAGNARYPVLYLIDGDAQINEIGSVVDFLSENNRMPEVIVVGIVNTDRFRDLTPTRADIKKSDGTIVFRLPTSGGASAFLSFITTELFPEVQRRYRSEPFRILAGHSMGGLFALHVLLTNPSLFGGYISISPSLEWDNEFILDRLQQTLRSSERLDATLFVSLSDEGLAVKRFGDDFNRLTEILSSKAPSGLRWMSIVMEDEDHNSGVLRAHYSALRAIFDGWPMPRERSTQLPAGGLAGIEEHYRQLSKRFGYAVSAEGTVNELGYFLLQQSAKDALEVFKRNVELYPDSANAYNSLADCYEALGKKEEAAQSATKAVELAIKGNSPQADEFKEHLRRLTSSKAEGPHN